MRGEEKAMIEIMGCIHQVYVGHCSTEERQLMYICSVNAFFPPVQEDLFGYWSTFHCNIAFKLTLTVTCQPGLR